jgi:uncharacterized protein YlxP (DUF503 family)
VQHRAHLVGRQVDVAFAVVADDKSVPVTMALDDALDLIEQEPGIAVSNVFDIESLLS